MIRSDISERPNSSQASLAVKSEDGESFQYPHMKKKRTSEDFYSFCNLILEYENYESIKKEDIQLKTAGTMHTAAHESKCQRGSGGMSASARSFSSADEIKGESDEDTYGMITCFCMKPFAGRPMIECSECLTWIHLSCAKIRRTHIPDEFICEHCRQTKHMAPQRAPTERRRRTISH